MVCSYKLNDTTGQPGLAPPLFAFQQVFQHSFLLLLLRADMDVNQLWEGKTILHVTQQSYLIRACIEKGFNVVEDLEGQGNWILKSLFL